MATVPLLADFAIRSSFGLILALILTSWHNVPLRFFRIQNQIVLGTLVLGALDQSRSSGPSLALWLIVGAAVLAYLATISWGLGLPRFGIGADILAALVTVAWLVDASRSSDTGLWAVNSSCRISSGLLLGATLTAMLLGHYYLTAPAMTIEPLKRSLNLIAVALIARLTFAGVGMWAGRSALTAPAPGVFANDAVFLAMRWGIGFLGAAVSVYLARRTVAIRSTQSATGILYITSIFVLLGELTSIVGAVPGAVR
ncbi:MAG: hypothetical protein ACLQGP_14105 [Isosphaeraceae bacterium]